MAIKIIDGPTAIENFRNNPNGEYPRRGDPDNRIEPRCSPGFRPSFRFKASDRIFTIGSCFARHVESALIEHGFDVVLQNPEFGPLLKAIGGNALNSFGVPSIFNELNWALAGGFDPKLNFLEITPGTYIDLHLPPTIRPAALDEVIHRRETICKLYAQVIDCQVVIITLGLTELWFDKLSGQYLNFTPRKAILRQFSDRFEFHVLDYATTASFLTRSLELLRQACRQPPKIILTVSPVPLVTTFTEGDVVVANSYSKSVLRVAAQEAAAAFPQADYYPSYESVTLSNRDVAWDDDLRHVQQPLIKLNVSRMVYAYTDQHGIAADATYGRVEEARMYLEQGNPSAALDRLGPPRKHELSEEILLRAEASAKLGNAADADVALQSVSVEAGGWLRALTEIRVKIALGECDNALELARQWAAREPKQGRAWQGLAEACAGLGRWADAIKACNRWCTVMAGYGEPFVLLSRLHRQQKDVVAAQQAFDIGLKMKHDSQTLNFSYLDFLIEQQRCDEARVFADSILPEDPAHAERLRDLRAHIAQRLAS